jgi:hypothetical protein
MAGIAIIESGGHYGATHLPDGSVNRQVLNDNPSSGDYSVGPWQINYFGANGPYRTAKYGSVDTVAADPLLNAKIAVDLAGANGQGIRSNWPNTWAEGMQVAKSSPNSSGIIPSWSQVEKAVGQGATGLVPGGSATLSFAGDVGGDVLNKLNPFSVFSGIAKSIMYSTVIFGGGMLILTGFIIVAADLGLAVFAGRKPTPVNIVVNAAKTRSKNRASVQAARQTAKDEADYQDELASRRATKKRNSESLKVYRQTGKVDYGDVPY